MRTREQEEELDRELHKYWSKESGPKPKEEPEADEDNMDTGEKLDICPKLEEIFIKVKQIPHHYFIMCYVM